MSDEKPPVILADWDEEKGPLIIDSIFPDQPGVIDDSPEVLITRCYISAQSIFARVAFSKINFNIPMVGIKKLAIIFFDVVEDESVRGDRRPFILVVFAPLDTNYGMIEPIQQVVEPYIEQYKNDQIPDLARLQDDVHRVLVTGARQVAGGVAGDAGVPGTAGTARKGVTTGTPGTAGTAGTRGASPSTAFTSPGGTTAWEKVPRVSVRSAGGSAGRRTTKPSFSEKIKDASYLDVGRKMFSIRVGPWKPEEIQLARELMEKGLGAREIAKEIHRTLKDVREQLEKLEKMK